MKMMPTMMSPLQRIRLNSSEENKNRGFFTLMTSGTSVMCLENEEYIVSKEATKLLHKKGIDFQLIEQKKMANHKSEESNSNAIKIKI